MKKQLIALVIATTLFFSNVQLVLANDENALLDVESYFDDLEEEMQYAEFFPSDGKKILQILITQEEQNSNKWLPFSDYLEEKILNINQQEWFDYDFIYIDVYNTKFGKILSSIYDLNGYTDYHVWNPSEYKEFDVEKENNFNNEGIETELQMNFPTYEQLARTPDNYKNENVTFTGEVLQVLEGEDEIQIRLAVDGDYNQVLYCGYSPDIVDYRILEGDSITIYGKSIGLWTYESTLGQQITIPAAWINTISLN